MESTGGFGMLAFVCVAMFASSIAAGLVAGALRLKDQMFRNINAMGGGLLLGAALGIVLPEGFSLVCQSNEDVSMTFLNRQSTYPFSSAGFVVLVGFVDMLLLERLGNAQGAACSAGLERAADPEFSQESRPRSAHRSARGGLPGGHHHLIEAGKAGAGAAEDGSAGGSESGKAGDSKFAAYLDPVSARSAALRSVLGLSLHCAADGFALGVAAGGIDAATQALVAGAMVAHKAPMAFGLAMHLVSLGLPQSAIRPYVIAFAAVAPSVALLTYSAINSFPMLDSTPVVATMLLLSGGSFLQVATLHVLPGVVAGAKMRELLYLAGGAFLPNLFASLGGGHSHAGHAGHHHG